MHYYVEIHVFRPTARCTSEKNRTFSHQKPSKSIKLDVFPCIFIENMTNCIFYHGVPQITIPHRWNVIKSPRIWGFQTQSEKLTKSQLITLKNKKVTASQSFINNLYFRATKVQIVGGKRFCPLSDFETL